MFRGTVRFEKRRGQPHPCAAEIGLKKMPRTLARLAWVFAAEKGGRDGGVFRAHCRPPGG